jgi:predicted nucleic acid-binding protein
MLLGKPAPGPRTSTAQITLKDALAQVDVVSALRRPDKADQQVVEWAARLPVASSFLSVVTLLELGLGALRVARRDDLQGAILRDWMVAKERHG